MLSLAIQKREVNKGGLNAGRKSGKIPAVYYGPKETTTPIWLAEKDFLKVLKKAGETSVISLSGVGSDVEALVHIIDREPVKDAIRHVDFYAIEKGKKITLAVPLNFVGISPAIKDLGGTLVKVLHELHIEALPKDLPHIINVDISSLALFGSQILAKDVKLSSGVLLTQHAQDVVAAIAEPREEKEEEAAPIDLSAIEVEKKGKEELAEGEAAVPGTETKKGEAKKGEQKKEAAPPAGAKKK